jgi:ThiF family
VSWGTADQIHRTAKILIDAGKASSPDEARRFLETLILQVAVGPDIQHDSAVQAALATIVNAGHRAFLGGVHVHLGANPSMVTGWAARLTAAETVTKYGGQVVRKLTASRPTLVLGHPAELAGSPLLYLTWSGWSGGVVQSEESRLDGDGSVLAGVAAAGLGISETFQRQLGAVLPGRRDIGISLWRPDLDWRHADAAGPVVRYLPASLWLLGLGHLGQAFAWTLGMLPYAKPGEAEFGLVDFDRIVEGNAATQLLARPSDAGRRKARVVADALERQGFATRLVERAYNEHFNPVAHADPVRNEPSIALSGFDDITPRRVLGETGFTHVVDAGLGSGPVEYLDMVLHSFPAAEDPGTAFAKQDPSGRPLPQAYEAEITRCAKAGDDETATRCGMLDIAGVTVGAAFVGAFASTLVVADIMRLLHGGNNYSVISIDLRSPSGIQAVPNNEPGEYPAPAYTLARRGDDWAV